MPHLVKPLFHTSLSECYRSIQEAHDFLVQRGASAIAQVQKEKEMDSASWGSAMKRLAVSLPSHERPALIDTTIQKHSLVEVIHQCATIERLLDALEWAQQPDSGLNDFLVERCHPTTSSAKSETKAIEDEEHDNDLVLVRTNQEWARFEVSDVTGEHDGNRKEEKDLISLGILRPGKGKGKNEERFVGRWPSARLFLVVSSEFSPYLFRTNRWLRRYHSYQSVFRTPGTDILEIVPRRG